MNHLLLTGQQHSSEFTRTRLEHFPVEFYTVHLEEHVKVGFEMLEVGIHSSV
jgi:hypothetical protein